MIGLFEHERQLALDALLPEGADGVSDDELAWLAQARVAYLEARRDPNALAALVPALARVFDEELRENTARTRTVARDEREEWAIEALPIVERVAAWAGIVAES